MLLGVWEGIDALHGMADTVGYRRLIMGREGTAFLYLKHGEKI